MNTCSPLPEWMDLAIALVKRDVDVSDIAKPWIQTDDIPLWLSRSAWSLKLLAEWCAQCIRRGTAVVWIPDYFCNQSLAPLRACAARIVFYPISDNIVPDWKACELLARDNPPDLFLAVHYFGCSADMQQARVFCDKHNAFLIEDMAHVLLPATGLGDTGDFVLYSQHKLLPVPSGALLIIRKSAAVMKIYPEIAKLSQMHRDLIRGCDQVWSRVFMWLFKRSIQRVIPEYIRRRFIKRVASFDDQFVSGDEKQDFTPPKMDEVSKRMMESLLEHLLEYGKIRVAHDLLLRRRFASVKGMHPFKADIPAFIPYYSVFECESATDARMVFACLADEGYLVQTWPDLPPEVSGDAVAHSVANGLRNKLIFFPVHHTLDLTV